MLEHARLDRLREQVVVDTEQHVALGVAGAQDRSVHQLARITGRHDRQGDAARAFERLDDLRTHVERVVGEQRDGDGLVAGRSTRSGSVASLDARDRDQTTRPAVTRRERIRAVTARLLVDGGRRPGRIASTTPVFDARSRRRFATNSLLMPRLEPGSSVAPVQRPANTARTDPSRGSAHREQAQRLAGHALTAHGRRGSRASAPGPKIASIWIGAIARGASSRARCRARWSSRPPSPPTIRARSTPCAKRGAEREIEVGGVLVDGMTLDLPTCRFDLVEDRRRDRVHIAHQQLDGDTRGGELRPRRHRRRSRGVRRERRSPAARDLRRRTPTPFA